jgi:hypothetical protein
VQLVIEPAYLVEILLLDGRVDLGGVFGALLLVRRRGLGFSRGLLASLGRVGEGGKPGEVGLGAGARRIAADPAVGVARLGIHQQDGGKTADAELRLDLTVPGLHLGRLRLLVRVVEFDQNVVLGEVLELLGRENLVAELDAEAAPVTAREVDEDGLLLPDGHFACLVEIGQPPFGGRKGDGRENESRQKT